MLTRSQSTVSEAKKELSFFSKPLKRSLDARLLKKSQNMSYYIIVDSNFDKSKRQVEIIAEVAVRTSSFSANFSSYCNCDYSLLEKELREKLFTNNSALVSRELHRYAIASESYAKQEMYEEAIKMIKEEYLPKDDSEAKAYFWLAWCEKRLMHYDKAIEYARKSIALEPSRLGYYNLACYLHLNGSPAEVVLAELQNAWIHAVTMNDKERFKSSLQKDEDLATLRVHPTFIQLLNEVERVVTK